MKQSVTVDAQLLSGGRYGCTIVMWYIEINKAVSQWLLNFNLYVSIAWPLTCAFHIPCTHTPEIIDIHRGVCDNLLNHSCHHLWINVIHFTYIIQDKIRLVATAAKYHSRGLEIIGNCLNLKHMDFMNFSEISPGTVHVMYEEVAGGRVSLYVIKLHGLLCDYLMKIDIILSTKPPHEVIHDICR